MDNSSQVWLCEFLFASADPQGQQTQPEHQQIEYVSETTSLGPTTIPVTSDEVEWKWTLVITQIIIPCLCLGGVIGNTINLALLAIRVRLHVFLYTHKWVVNISMHLAYLKKILGFFPRLVFKYFPIFPSSLDNLCTVLAKSLAHLFYGFLGPKLWTVSHFQSLHLFSREAILIQMCIAFYPRSSCFLGTLIWHFHVFSTNPY